MNPMSEDTEFTGDECIVLPRNYLNSAEAVADIYSEQLSAATSNFDIGQLSRRRRVFRDTVLVTILWALSGVWTVCS